MKNLPVIEIVVIVYCLLIALVNLVISFFVLVRMVNSSNYSKSALVLTLSISLLAYFSLGLYAYAKDWYLMMLVELMEVLKYVCVVSYILLKKKEGSDDTDQGKRLTSRDWE